MTQVDINPGGFNADLAPEEVGPEEYTSLQNFVHRNGRPIKALGFAPVFGTPLAPPKHLLFSEGDVDYWLYTGNSTISVTEGVNHFDITPVGLTPETDFNTWTGGELNGIPFLNHPLDQPWFWDRNTGNIMQPFPNFPANTTFGAFRQFKFNLIGMDITDTGNNFPDSLLWSDSADPGSVPNEWTPTPANDAGTNQLSDTPGRIIDGASLRGDFLIYKTHSTYLMRFIGGNFFFSFSKLFVTSGVMARNCIVELFGTHVVLADGDLIQTNGHDLKSIADKRIKQFFFSQLNQTEFETSFVAKNPQQSEVWFCIPTSGSNKPNLALIWNYQDNKFGLRDIPSVPHIAQGVVIAAPTPTWDVQIDDWDDSMEIWAGSGTSPSDEKLLMADFDGVELEEIDATDQADGVDVPALVQKLTMDMGSPAVSKTVRAIWPRVRGTTGDVLRVRIGGQQSPGDPIVFSPEGDFTIGVDDQFSSFANGKYISVQFRSTFSNSWILDGFKVEFTERSKF